MTIAFSTIATRIAAIGGATNDLDKYHTDIFDVRNTGLLSTLGGDTVVPGLNATIKAQADGYDALQSAWFTSLKTLATSIITGYVRNDVPGTPNDLSSCLTELVRQLRAQDTYYANYPVTLATAASATDPSFTIAGPLEVFTKALYLPVADRYRVVMNSTGYTITGKAANTNRWEATYPTGAGVNTSGTLLTSTTSSIVTDASFSTWTVTNTPTNWTIVTGTPGVSIFKGTVDPDDASGFCLRMVSNDANVPEVKQAVTVAANTCYGIRLSAQLVEAATTGDVTLSLRDASNNIIQDDDGTAFEYAATITGNATPTWSHHKSTFKTPSVLPAAVYLHIEWTDGGDHDGITLNIDHVQLYPLTALYAKGVTLAIAKKPGATVDEWNGHSFDITATPSATKFNLLFILRRLLQLDSYAVDFPTTGGTQITTVAVSPYGS